MKVSNEYLKLLRDVEGFENKPYLDSGGALTIGIGHLITKSERLSGKIKIGDKCIKYKDGLTDDQVIELSLQDSEIASNAVNHYVKVYLTQNQFNALVSFVFNIGVGAFKNSSLLKLLNQGKYGSVPTQMRRWVYDNGKVVKGLINRREKEIKLWLT